MIALQISPKIESFYGLGGQATKLLAGFVWNFATFVRLPFGQFSFVELLTWLGSFSFSEISVQLFRFQSNEYKNLC